MILHGGGSCVWLVQRVWDNSAPSDPEPHCSWLHKRTLPQLSEFSEHVCDLFIFPTNDGLNNISADFGELL